MPDSDDAALEPLERIEKLRTELHTLLEEEGVQSETTVRKSRELDGWLLKYQRATCKKRGEA